MKKFFSLFMFVALAAALMLLVACSGGEEPPVFQGEGPDGGSIVDHELVKNVVKPTCISGGYTEYTCKNCGYYYRDTFTEPKDHTWGPSSSHTTHPYVCTSVTTTVKTCKVCDFTSTTTSTKTNHNMVLVDSIAPTCTENGKQFYECAHCDYTSESTLWATGHVWGEWIVDIAPSCSDPTHVEFGAQHRTCQNCPWTEMTEVLPHTCHCEEEGYTGEPCRVVAPTCTTVGYTIHTCEECGVEYHRDFVAPTDHRFSEFVVVEGVEGFLVGECINPDCDHKEYIHVETENK